MEPKQTAFVVDGDTEVRQAMQTLLESVAIPVEAYGSALDFLGAVHPPRRGCIVLDARLPGMSGMELLQRVAAWEVPLPAIIITAYGDVPMAVEAMKQGAFDFIEKPFRHQVLVDSVYQAMERDTRSWQLHETRATMLNRVRLLTPREDEVMRLVVRGLPNKAIALRLGVTRKAIEAYRARVMRKMQAESLAALVRMNVMLERDGELTPALPGTGKATVGRTRTARVLGEPGEALPAGWRPVTQGLTELTEHQECAVSTAQAG